MNLIRELRLQRLVMITAVGLATAIAAPIATAADAMMPVTASAPNQVTIANFAFQPTMLEVKPGTKVTWINHDSTPHTVTSTDKRFVSSSGMDTDDSYSYVFDKPGTYEYFCSLHPMMVAKIVVR